MELNPELATTATELRDDGAMIVATAADNRMTGIISLSDPLRPTTLEAIKNLQDNNIQIIIATGDKKETAQFLAKQLGITDVRAEVLPEGKVKIINQLRKSGRIVAMAGDGINDAPALAAAQVGIAMGSGTDIAIETASLIAVQGDLRSISRARALSTDTRRNIRQNLSLSFIYNLLAIPIAGGLLFPFIGLLLSPTIAAAAMSLSSVSVISNALRLRTLKL